MFDRRFRKYSKTSVLFFQLCELPPSAFWISPIHEIFYFLFDLSFTCVFRYRHRICIYWQKKRNADSPDIQIAEYMIIICLNDYYCYLGNNLSTEGIGYQWEGARTWPSRYNEKLRGSFGILLSSPAHWVGSKVSEKRSSFLVGHILKPRLSCLAQPFDSKSVKL